MAACSIRFFHPQIAVDNGFGGVYGQQKADWMVDVIQQYFHDNGDERLLSFEPTDGIVQLKICQSPLFLLYYIYWIKE